MTILLANAAMPAPYYLLNPFESFRKLTALATPLPHPWSSSRSCLNGVRLQGKKKQQQLSSRHDVVKGEQMGCRSSYGDREAGRRWQGVSLYDKGQRHSESRLKRLDEKNSSSTELNLSSWPHSDKSESSRRTKWSSTHNGQHNGQKFNRATTLGTSSVARNTNERGGGNEESGRVNLGFRGIRENNLTVEEQKRVAFEDWAAKKFREAGSPALVAIEEMRQTFAPGSSSLLGTSQKRIDRNSNRYNQTVGKAHFGSSSCTGDQKTRLTSSEAAGGYRSSNRVMHRGSSSPTSRFGADRAGQQPVGRSSTRSESWSPKSAATYRGRSSWNVTSRRGVQWAAEVELSSKSSGNEESSSDGGSEVVIPQPLLVKRKTKFPINWHGRGGTVVLVDKPQGWTSFAVCSKLRHLLNIQKVGHAGTLDPMATGLLIVCLGKATKLADTYQAMTKVYSGTLRLGELTPSLDSFTEVSDVLPWEHITDEQLEQARQGFMGDTFQKPPMYSAIKIDGERLYKKARRGEQIEVPPRLITVTDFKLERNAENRQELQFRLECSKGTYVRSLCADLAQAVGSYAHLTALRRERIGKYSIKDAWRIQELVEEYIRTSK